MNYDFDTCYRAIQSRDTRFDGRFFTAVTSTGIYCRPVCPAQTPQERNVRFYPSAAAAEASGFRACRRCRPESVPGSPDWNVRADLVGRALRLIAEGALDTDGVDRLARRLTVSPRHLHRELVAAVGAGPLALARTRRAQTARLLIDNTDIPLSEVAFASGFRSIRQFNETMHEAFGCAPTDLRRRERVPLDAAGRITLRLTYRPPLAIDALLDFLAHRAVPGIEEVRGRIYRRTLTLGDTPRVIELEFVHESPCVLLRLRLDDPSNLGTLVSRCRQALDLDVDPTAVAETLSASPLLAPIVAQVPGLRVPGTMDGWETAVRAVLGQQISTSGARTLAARLVQRLGMTLDEPHGSLTHLFPTPQAMADGDMNGLGITGARINTMRALARAVTDGGLTLDSGADRDETRNRLLSIPGIGPWTASYVAMRALRDPDAFLASDLGIRRALERFGPTLNPKQIEALAEPWRPWRAYALTYLWHTLAGSTQQEASQ